MSDTSDFNVEYIAGKLDDNTVLITSQEDIDNKTQKLLLSALQKYDYNKQQYSAGFTESTASTELTVDRISELATGINTSLSNVLEVNRYVHKYIAIDDVIGVTYTSVQNNINTDYRLIYGNIEGRNKLKQLQNAKAAIEQFNRSVRLNQLIVNSVLGTLTDGSYIMCLRIDGGNAIIDMYPLGIAEITKWSINNEPVVQINLNEFKSRLRKTYTKGKNGKALFFENLEKEVQANFPAEVYAAYKNGETYCRLDVKYTGVLRINNLPGYEYGVSHFFKALRPAVILENIESADIINNKAKAKKLIHQKLRKEVMGPQYNLNGIEKAIYAHKELMAAWQNQTVVYTSIPAVEDIKYVEPSVEGTPTEKISLYRNEKMTALGITFLDPELNSVSSANISLKQLMKTVDSISRQLSDILHRFYVVYLESQGIDQNLAPDIKIMNSEQMEMDVKKSLVELMFSKLNLSYESCLDVLGFDVDDEKAKREAENTDNFSEIFTPRASQYTSGGNDAGRPPSDNPDSKGKQDYDDGYNDNNR